MATEHTLQLKAVLDTQQVQQQLQQLKQAQQGNAAASPSAGGLSQQSVATMTRSFANINSTLQKLNTSIQQLSRTAATLKKANVATRVITRNVTSSKGSTQLSEDDDSVYRIVKNKRIMAFIGGTIIGGIGNRIADAGYTKTGAIVGAAGKGLAVGAGAAYTANMFGMSKQMSARIGILAGIVSTATSVVKAFNDLADASKKAAETQREIVKQQTKEAFDLQKIRYQYFDRQLAQDVLKTENRDIAKARLEYSKSISKSLDAKYKAMEDPAYQARRVRESAEKYKSQYTDRKTAFDKFSDAMSTAAYAFNLGDIKDTENAIDVAANKIIEQYKQRFIEAHKEAQQARATYELWQGVNDQLKKVKEEVEDRMSKERIKEANRKVAVMDETRAYVDQFRYDKAFNQTQILANGVLGNESLAPRQQFDQLAAELDKLREQRNSRLTEAYDINRKLMLTDPKKTTAGQYEDMSKSRKRALSDASALDQRIALLETAMTRITNNIVQPDVSHVTSLAQYGFGMGEKDRTVEVMQKYYSKMENLTRAIKDKLDQGITTRAVYDF